MRQKIQVIYCDGCGSKDKEIISTFVAERSFNNQLIMRESEIDSPRIRDGYKARDYCVECVEADIYFCERCQAPHQSECPVDAQELEVWWTANAHTLTAAAQEDDLPF